MDISASLENRDTMLSVVKKTANEVFIPLTVGGGISSLENIHSLDYMHFYDWLLTIAYNRHQPLLFGWQCSFEGQLH